ncbi:MAG: oxygen-dependent tRNA uridine(34) hydroxylase TrhO [Bdellovibrionota bacterium]
MRVLNVAFYHFFPLQDPNQVKLSLRTKLETTALKGTLILAPEGINGVWAGPESEVRAALDVLQAELGLQDLRWKESFSGSIPFEHLVFKVKAEIVTFRVPELSPPPDTAGRLNPKELAEWYSQGKDFIVLDTRNEFEFRLGRFAGAKSLEVNQFVKFASAAETLGEDWKSKPIVTYCTGGIRCEKAAPFLASLGFSDVYQLDGGILGYFEAMGGSHWEGECFVFDQRVAVDPALAPTGARLCSVCQGPIPKASARCIHCDKENT